MRYCDKFNIYYVISRFASCFIPNFECLFIPYIVYSFIPNFIPYFRALYHIYFIACTYASYHAI